MRKATVIIFAFLLGGFLFGCGNSGTSNGALPPGNSGGQSGGSGGNSSSETYFGTQSPGDVWTWTANGTSFGTATTFTAKNITASTTYAGAISAIGNGFLELNLTSVNGTSVSSTSTTNVAYALELPNAELLIGPANGFKNSLGAADMNPIVAAGETTTSNTSGSFNMLNMPKSGTLVADGVAMSGMQLNGGSLMGNAGFIGTGTACKTDASCAMGNVCNLGSGTCTGSMKSVTFSGMTSMTNFLANSFGLFVADLGMSGDMNNLNSAGLVGASTTNTVPAISAMSSTNANYNGFAFGPMNNSLLGGENGSSSAFVSVAFQATGTGNGGLSVSSFGGCVAPTPPAGNPTAVGTATLTTQANGITSGTYTQSGACGGAANPIQAVASTISNKIVMFVQSRAGMAFLIQK